MKIQYLGDSKDCFKWDYHDFLTNEMRYNLLNVVFMLTPDEKNNHGNTRPGLFPADEHIIDFCNILKETKDPERIADLPKITSSSYEVSFHNLWTYLDKVNRYQYFSDISKEKNQVIFLDPDNGFEPERSSSEKHVGYQDVFRILDQAPKSALVSVFQHSRRISFRKDYDRIKERLDGLPSTAIQWNNSLMFVNISKSDLVIQKAKLANNLYSRQTPKTTVL